MVLVVVPTEKKDDMMFVAVPTMVLTLSSERSLWLLFPFSDFGGYQAYL